MIRYPWKVQIAFSLLAFLHRAEDSVEYVQVEYLYLNTSSVNKDTVTSVPSWLELNVQSFYHGLFKKKSLNVETAPGFNPHLPGFKYNFLAKALGASMWFFIFYRARLVQSSSYPVLRLKFLDIQEGRFKTPGNFLTSECYVNFLTDVQQLEGPTSLG
jgi:hypothetical protein